MKEDLKQLYVVQLIDLRVAELKKLLAGLDNGESIGKQKVLWERKLAADSAKLKQTEAELKDSELKLQSIETKKKQFENRLYEGKVTNPKELSSIEKEIEILGKNRSALDGKILELYDVVSTQKADVDKATEQTTLAGKILAQRQAKYKAESTKIDEEMAQLMTRRAQVVAQIPNMSLLQRYEASKSRHKDTGLAVVEGNKCGACHMTLPSFVIPLLREDGDFHMCESCGRILYLPEVSE